MQTKFEILDYLGKLNDGILTLVSVEHEGVWYESTFYYTREMLALTVDKELEDKLGCQIEDWSGYRKLMMDIVGRVVPYDEIIVRIDDFDPKPLLEGIKDSETEAEEVDSKDIISATQSQ